MSKGWKIVIGVFAALVIIALIGGVVARMVMFRSGGMTLGRGTVPFSHTGTMPFCEGVDTDRNLPCEGETPFDGPRGMPFDGGRTMPFSRGFYPGHGMPVLMMVVPFLFLGGLVRLGSLGLLIWIAVKVGQLSKRHKTEVADTVTSES